jgi:hypothetical protein
MSVLLNLYSEMNLQPLGNRIGSEMVCMISESCVRAPSGQNQRL